MLYLYTTQIGLNLISRRWTEVRWLKPSYILLLSFVAVYFITPTIEPESARKCGMSMIAIILTGIYGVMVSSVIYLVFRSISLRDRRTTF